MAPDSGSGIPESSRITASAGGPIAILGAGAIGCSLGAMLWQSGRRDVVLVGRSEQVKAIRSEGLHVDGPSLAERLPVPATTSLADPPEILFLTVKVQDVEPSLRAVGPLPASTTIVTCQNGIEADAIALAAGGDAPIVGAVVNIHATYLVSGRVSLLYPGPIVLGRPDGVADERVGRVARVLRPIVPVSVTDNLLGARWFKLIINLNNAFPAVTGMAAEKILAHSKVGRYAVLAMREGIEVARRLGVRLEGLPDTSVRLTNWIERLPTPLAAWVVAAKARQAGRRGPLLGSTLQSLRRGRPTEVTYLNGAVARAGERVGYPTPINRLLTEEVHRVAQTGEYLSPDALISVCRTAEVA